MFTVPGGVVGDGLDHMTDGSADAPSDGLIEACCEACGLAYELGDLGSLALELALDGPVLECDDCGGPVYADASLVDDVEGFVDVPVEVPVGLDLAPLADAGAW